MPVDFEYRAGMPLVRVGRREPYVCRLDQALTYEGLLEGAPTRPMNERMLAPLREAARSRGTLLIEPVVAKRGLFGGWNLDGHYPEFLPGVRIAMLLHDAGGAFDTGADYSELTVLFFQARFAPPLDDQVAEALRGIEWERHAIDGHY